MMPRAGRPQRTTIELIGRFHQSGFAVICNQALNSLSSQRFRARLARNRLAIVASLLDDSAIGPRELAVIATPSRTRPAQNVTGSIASIP
jgi:hypothetical protein